jgi:hypothetical protein
MIFRCPAFILEAPSQPANCGCLANKSKYRYPNFLTRVTPYRDTSMFGGEC